MQRSFSDLEYTTKKKVTRRDRFLGAIGDTGYQGVSKRPELKHPRVRWFVALGPWKPSALPDTEEGRLDERVEKFKASIRAKVEQPFHYVKNLISHK